MSELLSEIEQPSFEQESAWIKQAQAGDPEAFGALYAQHMPRIQKYAYRYTGNWAYAEDIAQTASLRVFASLDKFEDKGKGMGGYFMTIATHLLIDTFRKKHRNEPNDFDPEETLLAVPDAALSVEDNAIANVTVDNILTALRTTSEITEDQHLALRLHCQGYTNSEIAEQLAIREGAVKSRLHRARHKYREALAKAALY